MGSGQPKKSSAWILWIFSLSRKNFYKVLWAVGSLKIHTHTWTQYGLHFACAAFFIFLTHLQTSGLWAFGRPYKRAQLCLFLWIIFLLSTSARWAMGCPSFDTGHFLLFDCYHEGKKGCRESGQWAVKETLSWNFVFTLPYLQRKFTRIVGSGQPKIHTHIHTECFTFFACVTAFFIFLTNTCTD